MLISASQLARLRFGYFFLLVSLCFTTICQFAHLHHLHEGDILAFEISCHPLSIAIEHPSIHQHHDEESSHPQNNHQQYESQPDWDLVRLQSSCHLVTNSQDLLSFSLLFFPQIGYSKLLSFFDKPFHFKNFYSPHVTIRGPPLS